MQGFADAIKYFYQQFILRDFLAYVTPGALVIACVLFVKTGNFDTWLKTLGKIPLLAYLVLFGLSFAIGFALQNIGEKIGVVKGYYGQRTDNKDK